jgi:ribosome modulation factor
MNQMEEALKKANIPPLTKEHIAARILARDRGICAGKLNREGKSYDACPYDEYDTESDLHSFWLMGFRAAMNFELREDIQHG